MTPGRNSTPHTPIAIDARKGQKTEAPRPSSTFKLWATGIAAIVAILAGVASVSMAIGDKADERELDEVRRESATHGEAIRRIDRNIDSMHQDIRAIRDAVTGGD